MFPWIFPTPQEVFHTGGVNSSGQSVRVFSVNMARSVFLETKRLFLIFDFPILIFQTSLTQALRGWGIASSSFILFFYLLYWYYSYIVYFVCAPASEFGAMGSTSFLGFSYPNLLLVFLNLLLLRNLLYHIFLAASVGTLSGSFLFYRYFSVPYFGLA